MGKTFIEGERNERILSLSAVNVLDKCHQGLYYGIGSYKSAAPYGENLKSHKNFVFFPTSELKDRAQNGELRVVGDVLRGFMLVDDQGQNVRIMQSISIRAEEFEWIKEELKTSGVVTF